MSRRPAGRYRRREGPAREERRKKKRRKTVSHRYYRMSSCLFGVDASASSARRSSGLDAVESWLAARRASRDELATR
jgi:hypothetical protein